MKIKTVPTNTEIEPFHALYQPFLAKGLSVPVPLELMSASKSLFHIYGKFIGYFFEHETLNAKLLVCIRYAVAHRSGFQACIDFNRTLLGLHGLDDSTETLEGNTLCPPLDPLDLDIFHFAIDTLFFPGRVTMERIHSLEEKAISQQTLFDAAFHGSLLLMMGPLVHAL